MSAPKTQAINGRSWQGGSSIHAPIMASFVAAIANHGVTSGTMSDPNSSFSIDRDQAILLASRIFAAFLLFWVVEDITELPREIFSLTHYLHGSTEMGMSLVQALRSSYLVGEYMLSLLANILHIALWLLAAGWFYRCGPRIRSFFSAAAA
jgi:hypothetical protein